MRNNIRTSFPPEVARPPAYLSLGRAGIAIFAVSILNYSNMSKFIILHLSSGNKPVYINVEQIAYFHAIEKCTKVMISGKDAGLNITESVDEIDVLIRKD